MKSPREESLGAYMAIALQLMKKKHQKSLAEAGSKITLEQLAILEILGHHGDMNMTELSIKTWKHNANITRIVDKLEKQQLVERRSVEGDRRANLIGITGKGKNLYDRLISLVMENNKEITSCITKEEETAAINTMIKIINNLSKE